MLKSKKSGDQLSVYLCGEIDHCVCSTLRQEIESQLNDPRIKRLHLDFSQVTFIDSSGVGMLIGRYKTMIAKRGSVSASGLSEPVNRLFHLAGLHRIIPITANGGQHDE